MRTMTRGRVPGVLILAAAFMALTTAPAAAQSLGFRAGANHASVDFETVPAGMSVGYTTNWHAGAYVEMPVLSFMSVVAEARFANKGWTLNFRGETLLFGDESSWSFGAYVQKSF